MHPDYDEMLEAYERDGVIPIATRYTWSLGSPATWHECPWCKTPFAVVIVDDIHCPYCCMEMKLDWSDA